MTYGADDQDLQDRHFGEQGARLTYGSYLRVAELLDQQHLESDPPAHDELLFITIHQVYELWFKQLLHELTATREEMFSGDLWRARHLLSRVVAIEDVLIRQIAVLETMTPQDFLVFRDRLAPASGFQSVQFRELEFLSGAKDPGYLERFRGLTDDETARLERRLAEPSLWDGFLHVVRRAGLHGRRRRPGARVAADGDRRPHDVRRGLGARRAAARPRRERRDVALPARADGRAADRHEVGHRRLERVAVPAEQARAALLPAALGAALALVGTVAAPA